MIDSLLGLKLANAPKKALFTFTYLLFVNKKLDAAFDFDAVKNRNYQSASAYIRDEWGVLV
jgi:hypothetical protein